MKFILKNPLVHFCFIGAVLFYCYQVLRPADLEEITVKKQTVEALIKAEQELSQLPITEDKRKAIVENYIDEEVLLREAFKRGLQKNDFRVRKRLLTLMRSSLIDVVPQPTTAQLRAYYDENKEKFIIDKSVSFEMVKFAYNSKNIPEKPDAFIKILEESDHPFQYSENNSLGNSSLKNSYREVARTLGKEMAEKVFKAPVNQWTGPVTTMNSIVYFRVIEFHAAYYPDFEMIESYLQDEYYITKSRALQQDKINDLRTNYSIVFEKELSE